MLYPLSEGLSESNVLKSRFVCLLLRMDDPSSFEGFYKSFKERFPKGDHYPYAYRVGPVSKSSDDGEPGGSAGRPYLEMLTAKGIDHCLLMCARFFGGTKLGAGRLARTFVSTASDALKNARYGQPVELSVNEVELSYADYEKLRKTATKLGLIVKDGVFTEHVTATILSVGGLPKSLLDYGIEPISVLSKGTIEEIREVDA